MGYWMKMPKYKISCVVIYISENEMFKLGYVADYEPYPILGYKVIDDDSSNIFRKDKNNPDKYNIISDHLIKKTITVKEAQDAYPEIFL